MPSPNKFALTAEIPLPAMKYLAVEPADALNGSARSVVLVLRLFGDGPAGPVFHPEPFRLQIGPGNTGSDALEVNTEPGTLLSVFKKVRVIPGEPDVGDPPPLPPDTRVLPAVAGAFEAIAGAWGQALATGENGDNAILQALAALTLIPAGAIAP
jgi:hypothetical protein